jgi:predicted metal-dependent hydrolase
MPNSEDAPLIVAFVDDLMFTSKIGNVARGLDCRVRWIGSSADLEGEEVGQVNAPGEPLSGKSGRLFELLTAWQPSLLLFDLANAGVPWQRWMPALKSSPATRRIPIVAFGPHTNVTYIEEAKRLGAEAVWARSRFTADMPALLEKYLRVPDREAIETACQEPLPDLARSGIELFNQGAFYPSHDDLEEAWRQDQGAARDLYRGILQVGIAYYQIERGNYRGALKMLLRARQWLEPLPDTCRGVNVEQLREDAAAVQEALLDCGPDALGSFDRSLFKAVLLVNE